MISNHYQAEHRKKLWAVEMRGCVRKKERRGERERVGAKEGNLWEITLCLRRGCRSYTPEYSTGIMDKSQRMTHRRKRDGVSSNGGRLTFCINIL